jgi:hypothetical protein
MNSVYLGSTDISFIDQKWVQNQNATFLQKHVLARGAYLSLAAFSFIGNALGTIAGLSIAVMAPILTKNNKIYNLSSEWTACSGRLFSQPYACFLRTINPEAEINKSRSILSSSILQPLVVFANTNKGSSNFLKKHVASRLTYGLLAISCLVIRAVQGVISIPTTLLSILTLGKFQFINTLAHQNLIAPIIIHELFRYVPQFINPWADLHCR